MLKIGSHVVYAYINRCTVPPFFKVRFPERKLGDRAWKTAVSVPPVQQLATRLWYDEWTSQSVSRGARGSSNAACWTIYCRNCVYQYILLYGVVFSKSPTLYTCKVMFEYKLNHNWILFLLYLTLVFSVSQIGDSGGIQRKIS